MNNSYSVLFADPFKWGSFW